MLTIGERMGKPDRKPCAPVAGIAERAERACRRGSRPKPAWAGIIGHFRLSEPAPGHGPRIASQQYEAVQSRRDRKRRAIRVAGRGRLSRRRARGPEEIL